MIIGVSGKIGSGKDTVGSIIQLLTRTKNGGNFNTEHWDLDIVQFIDRLPNSDWNHLFNFEVKKFADKLKEIVALLIGCTREDLENRDFKETPLSEEWWYYKLTPYKIVPRNYYPNQKDNEMCEQRYLVKTTPRLLLQLIGTEAGRNIIHPNVWINSLFSDYKGVNNWDYLQEPTKEEYERDSIYPNWIITDMRFENELEAVKQRGGITIRVNRGEPKENEHASETGLDNATFDYVIDNNGTIEELVEKVRIILKTENIL